MTRNHRTPEMAEATSPAPTLQVIGHGRHTQAPAVTIALRRAYTYLSARFTDSSSYLLAEACILPVLGSSMSESQRMHVCYTFSTSLAGRGECNQAVNYAEEAVDLAEQLDDQAALITLLRFRGGLFRTVGALQQAARDYRECIMLIRTSPAGLRFRGKSLELDLLGRLAGLELYLTRYDSARQCLLEGRSMTQAQLESPVAKATLEWTQALLDRWSGQPDQALQHGLNALEAYSAGTFPLSESRLRVAIVEIALDLAKKLPVGTARDHILTFAGRLLAPALSLSTEYQDVTGQCLIELARIRQSRLAHHEENRVASIGLVQQKSEQLHDDALLAQAYTLLAEEYVEQHNFVSAQESFRQAVRLAEASAAPALGVWAIQGLLESEKGGSDE